MCVPAIVSSQQPLVVPSSSLQKKSQANTTAVTPSASPIRNVSVKAIDIQMEEIPSLIGDYCYSSSQRRGVKNSKNFSRLAHHDYHDHSQDSEEIYMKNLSVSRGGISTPFPLLLHEMLENVEREGYGHIVSWQPHGRCFVIHKKKEFINHVMPVFMRQSKFPSFRRQLNLYGFQRITAGPDRGGYYHELFLRGKPFLTRRMQRHCIKGTRVRCRNNPEEEPNFYEMEPVRARSIANKDRPTKPIDCESVKADLVLSSVPYDGYSDVACFAGKSFHLIDVGETLPEMENIISSAKDDELKIPIVGV